MPVPGLSLLRSSERSENVTRTQTRTHARARAHTHTHMHSRTSDGLKFGATYLAYPGDPRTHHASLIVTVVVGLCWCAHETRTDRIRTRTCTRTHTRTHTRTRERTSTRTRSHVHHHPPNSPPTHTTLTAKSPLAITAEPIPRSSLSLIAASLLWPHPSLRTTA